MVAHQAPESREQAAMREKIRTQARAALTAGIVSCIFAGIIFGPGALIRASIVRGNVARYNVGHEHLPTAKTATILGIVGLSIWTLLLIAYVS
jgi:2',3'-cyclic-nucleotide 2'-phosphodiesterase (5'-nucleotidase family)